MIAARPIRNAPEERKHFTLEATVIGYSTITTGWWIWKKEWPTLVIKLGPEARRELTEKLLKADPELSPPKDNVTFSFLREEERNAYEIDEVVELKYSIAEAMLQFFGGAPPFQWDGIQKKGLLAA